MKGAPLAMLVIAACGVPGQVSALDPCGAAGHWTALCNPISTSCGDYPGNAYTFYVTATVAALGGEITDNNGNRWGFDPETCTAQVLDYSDSAVGMLCPNIDNGGIAHIDFNGPASILVVPAVDVASCSICSPILECGMTSDADTCIDADDECDYRFPDQCCSGVCVGQGSGINTTFLCT